MGTQRRSAELAGRTALVTGAGRGIGAATALALDRAGARVALLARSADELQAVAESLENEPVVVPCDVTDPAAIAAALGAVHESFDDALDIVVNNAAAALRVPALDLRMDDFDRLWTVNVRAVLQICVAAIPGMVARGGGSIVNVSSISGLRGAVNRAAYSATKAAIVGMSRSLAAEFGAQGVRVNVVAPGIVATAMWADLDTDSELRTAVAAKSPLARVVTADEVAEAIVFLAGDRGSAFTAEVLSPDGGMAASFDFPRAADHPPVGE
jgi:NAD(P)-dependent dehydrogenase (short-subunit alcohol dehydrogenase family)